MDMINNLFGSKRNNTTNNQNNNNNDKKKNNNTNNKNKIEIGEVILERKRDPPSTKEFLYPHIKPEERRKIGVIGIGSRLISLLRPMLMIHKDLLELVAATDNSKICLENAQNDLDFVKFDIYESVDVMFQEHPEIEWVMIGSMNHLHCEHVLKSFKAGKHVFCEKPIAVSIQDCQLMIEAQNSAKKLFATGFVLRYAPLYEKIKSLIDQEKFGKIISIEQNEFLSPAHGGYIMRNWRRFEKFAGPHILEKCCHDIDICNWLVNSVPKRVASFGGLGIFIPENKPVEEDEQMLYTYWDQAWEHIDPFTSEKDIIDNQVCILEYRNGVRTVFSTNSCTAWPERKITICGTKATLSADLITGKIKFKEIKIKYEHFEENVNAFGIHGGGDSRIINDLAKSMETLQIPKATGKEGLISAVVCLMIDEARKDGKIVDLEPVWKKLNLEMLN